MHSFRTSDKVSTGTEGKFYLQNNPFSRIYFLIFQAIFFEKNNYNLNEMKEGQAIALNFFITFTVSLL